MRFLHALAALALLSLPVQAEICGAPEDLAAGNAFSDLTYAAFAIDPPPEAAAPTDPTAQLILPTGGDDTTFLQTALVRFGHIRLAEGAVYTLSRHLVLGGGMSIAGDGAGATLWIRNAAAGGIGTSQPSRTTLFTDGEEALSLSGDGIELRNLFIVKEYQDDSYAVGVTIRNADNVTLDRLRLRGFALAPGIVSVQGGRNITISNSIIHASCSNSVSVPDQAAGGDLGAFQITGITVDDLHPNGWSSGVVIRNNVIRDLRIEEAGNPRGDQSDGINIHRMPGTSTTLIEGNHISRVAEAIDLFGENILVRNNTVSGAHLAIKLIHGARRIYIEGNRIEGAPQFAAVGVYSASPGTGAERQVRDVTIIENEFRLDPGTTPAVLVERRGDFAPTGLSVFRNRFYLGSCTRPAVACPASQCWEHGNQKLDIDEQGC